jgi:hypothetical protein
MEDFNDLRVWQKAPELTLAVYRKAQPFRRKKCMAASPSDDVDRSEACRGMRTQVRSRNAALPANRVTPQTKWNATFC